MEKLIKMVFGDRYKVPVEVVLTPEEQDYPERSDGVIVTGKIKLPAICGRLDDEIIFGGRVCIVDCPLYPDWGRAYNEDWRVAGREFVAPTWRAALEMAETWAIEEVKKLKEALRAREEAFRAADG